MKRTLYHLFDHFDISHAILGLPCVVVFFIDNTLGACWFFGFLVYEIWQSIEKGDAAWPAIKGFLFGTMASGLLAGLIILMTEVRHD